MFPLSQKRYFKSDCLERKGKKKIDQDSEDGNVDMVEGYDSSDVLFISKKGLSNEWILDSGYTFHMTPNRQLFNIFQSIDEEKVLMGNHSVCKVNKIGNVKLKLEYGVMRTLSNVRYIPKLKRNLIFLRVLDSSRYL